MKTLRTVLLLLICLGSAAHAEDYQPPALYKDTESLRRYLTSEPRLVRARFQDNLTLLHFAAVNGDTTGAKLIIQKGGAVNATDNLGQTPLHKTRLVSMAELLLEQGADTTIRDTNGRTPFDLALAEDRRAVIPVLARRTIIPAVEGRDLRTVQRVLIATPEAVSATGKDGAMPLHYAVDIGDQAICEALISAGADANARKSGGLSPLHVAAALGRTGIIGLLLDKGADPNAKDGLGRTPLDLAKERDQHSAMKLLEGTGKGDAGTPKPQPKPSGAQSVRALLLAILQNDLPKVTEMLDADPSLARTADVSGITGLMTAVDTKKKDIAMLLIEKGADVNAKDVNGLTALFRAIDDFDLAKLLISAGADVKARSNELRTPLHEVARFGAKEVAELLTKSGADVNATDADGMTPLAHALRSKRADMGKTLRDLGAKG